MADIDENPPIDQTNNDEGDEADDETQDFLLFSKLASKSGHHIPKRGEKDFEPHGTKQQDGILANSRRAMHDILDYARVHTSKAHIRGFYYGPEGLDKDEVFGEEWTKGLTDDHIVVVETQKGTAVKVMGQSILGKRQNRLWLLPEEALYLVERGDLDLWWPSRSIAKTFMVDEKLDPEELDRDEQEIKEGFPVSLQAAYALFLGNDSEKGKISLERFSVYANLKRTGYIVRRPSEPTPLLEDTLHNQAYRRKESTSIFSWLFDGIFAEEEVKHPAFGPLVKPGMYRSYNSIYRQISVIPTYKPSRIAEYSSPLPKAPFSIVFEVWQATRIPTFAKSNPGIPDFRLVVLDTRSSSVPTLAQMGSLLESTPWDPPLPALKGSGGPVKQNQRLKHGYRNVVLAVVDQGIISYLRVAEAAFGEEKIYENFDRGSSTGPKRGGGSRGRGRGRGRGGRGGQK